MQKEKEVCAECTICEWYYQNNKECKGKEEPCNDFMERG
jgi:hypothetical protein